MSGWWLVKVVDCGLVDRRGRGLAAGRAARVGSGSDSTCSIKRSNEVRSARVCRGEVWSSLAVGIMAQPLSFSSGLIFSKSESFVQSTEVYSHSARPRSSSVSMSALLRSELSHCSSVCSFVQIEVRRRLTSSAATRRRGAWNNVTARHSY